MEIKLTELRKQLTDAQYNQTVETQKKTSEKILECWEKNGQKVFALYPNAIGALSASLTRSESRNSTTKAQRIKRDSTTTQAEEDALDKRLKDRTLDDEQKKQLEEASEARKKAYGGSIRSARKRNRREKTESRS